MVPQATTDETTRIRDQAGTIAPVIWLLGKVQSGKTSIVRALTGASWAEVGEGFRACTKTAEIFDFPAEAPLIRFLDTRGLSEAHYDPEADLAVAAASSHATIATMRAMDPDQDAVFDVLAAIRRKRPDWPIVVAQTHLHEGYSPDTNHPTRYPYGIVGDAGGTNEAAGNSADPAAAAAATADVNPALRRALAYQRERFVALPGDGPLAFVPLDFTRTGDGLTPILFGLEALHAALAQIAPSVLRLALQDAQAQASGGHGDANAATLQRTILGHAMAAAAADLVPLAAVAAVPAVQARLLSRVAASRQSEWTRRRSIEFAAALGLGFAARYTAGFGIRQLAKLIPVYGQTAGAAAAAASSFATTYALGKAAVYYLAASERGESDASGVQRVWASALAEAFDIARQRGLDDESGKRT